MENQENLNQNVKYGKCKRCGEEIIEINKAGMCFTCAEGMIDIEKAKNKFLESLNQNVKKESTEEEINEYLEIIKISYPKIIKVLKKYCDMDEEYYNIVALWIIGTYLHKNFVSYPYLFFNAMRGSGKSRILNLISNLSHKGELLVSLSESVLFRTAKNCTFCIDEFESIGSKEKGALRELLNAGYKKGMVVKRNKKVSTKNGESYQIERFEVFCPIVMANIWGMDEVLSDRCITLILEKSNNYQITKLMEIFSIDEEILSLKSDLGVVSVMTLPLGNNYMCGWNEYILNNKDTNDTNYIHNIYDRNDTNDTFPSFFNKIEVSGIDSRNLELFFPLFIISTMIDENVLDETIKTAKNITKSKKDDDIIENRDISLIEFISQREPTNEFIPMGKLLIEFKTYLKEEEENNKYINSRWLGRALKRMNLVDEKRRLGSGREIRINFKKAKNKIKLYSVDSVDSVDSILSINEEKING